MKSKKETKQLMPQDQNDEIAVPLCGDLDVIEPEQKLGNQELECMMREGILKHLVIVHRPFGGNTLFFYNQNLVPILDALSLYEATKVFFTNQKRKPNGELLGRVIMDKELRVQGKPSLTNKLILTYPGREYIFHDEYSFWKWNQNLARITMDATALIQ